MVTGLKSHFAKDTVWVTGNSLPIGSPIVSLELRLRTPKTRVRLTWFDVSLVEGWPFVILLSWRWFPEFDMPVWKPVADNYRLKQERWQNDLKHFKEIYQIVLKTRKVKPKRECSCRCSQAGFQMKCRCFYFWNCLSFPDEFCDFWECFKF